MSRRQLLAAGTTGLIATAAVPPAAGSGRRRTAAADGTPEQIHLTWADDPARSVVVSWTSPGRALAPRVRIGQRVIAAVERGYADPAGGEVVWTYHALVDGLRPGATYGYAVTADNDRSAADPFSATFMTAPEGRAAFRFSSFGDLTPAGAPWASAASQSGSAVALVESFQPLFHLLNGDLADADPSPAAQPGAWREAWRELAATLQGSAANRPWLPVPGGHGAGPAERERALGAYLARYALPGNGVPGFEGRWYGFRVGTAAFLCLDGDGTGGDGGTGGGHAGDASPGSRSAAGGSPAAGSSAVGSSAVGSSAVGSSAVGSSASGSPASGSSASGSSASAQTRWLEAALAAARGDASIDWVVVQLHPRALSSAAAGDATADAGPRREWLSLFDRYEVDLVLSGHSRGYERSFPVRGRDCADARRPHPVTTVDSGVFDTSQGTVHLALGGGGAGDDETGGADAGGAVQGGQRDGDSAAGADAAWTARRITAAGYGVAVFDVNPGSEAGAQTSITVRYYHAVEAGPGTEPGSAARADDYALFDTFTLVRPRSDGRRWHPKEPAASHLA